jgi:hypothetical protein
MVKWRYRTFFFEDSYLDETFVHWIGHRGTIEWLPRSVDLTPCDFSLWEIVKNRVYAQILAI